MNFNNAILAAVFNAEIMGYADLQLVIAFTDPNDNDEPYDLTIFQTLVLVLKRTLYDEEEVISLDLNDGLSVNNTNELIIDLTKIQTDLQIANYSWIAQGNDGTYSYPIMEGIVKVYKNIMLR